MHVTRYAYCWNIGLWFLLEAEAGRSFGGDVLEISGRSSLRKYMTRPNTTFTEAMYPRVDVRRMLICEASNPRPAAACASCCYCFPPPPLLSIRLLLTRSGAPGQTSIATSRPDHSTW